jgi:putative membrane protein
VNPFGGWMSGVLFLVGIILGLLSGLLPGLHSNTIISVISSLGIDEEALAIIIISLFPVHLVTSFIPSRFFGIPESGTVLAVLPGQRMVLKGKGIAALKTVLLSSIFAALISVSLFNLSLDLFPLIYEGIRSSMKYILLTISIVLVARSRRPSYSIIVFLLAGMLGVFSLNSEMADPFLPMFSGMFAIAAILNYQKGSMPQQKDTPISYEFMKFSFIGVILGFITDLIPGVGSPSQVAAFLTIFMPINTLGYLATISSISVSQAIFSLSTAASINKTRVGATAWLSEFIKIEENLLMLLTIFTMSMAAAVLLIYALRNKIAKLASLDFSRMNIILAVYLVLITFVIDGFTGLVVLTIGSGLGWLTIRSGIERINLMGAVIVPTLLLLFRIFI